MDDRRKFVRRQADRAVLKRVMDLEQWRGDTPASELRQRLRRAIRHNCTAHISMNIRYSSGFGDTWSADDHPVKGRVLDLSGEGCALFVYENLDIGQRVSLLITLRSGSKVHSRAVVRWTKVVEKRDGYACGLQFENLELRDQQMIQFFLKELDETIGL
ncbi:MAG: PilZ domain-containing protein [Candidatus Hydrogenedentes bacterium]|nr:PilZ domain-containing protein [Candidatus Hydrogenedentota bacterium]MBI3117890.1 PilZ domain-containing protein [Candidatus Hydrogenedentota bacterium]